MDSESSTKFIGSLTKFLQSLCNGYVEFDDGVELIGHIYLSVDAGKTGKTLNYFLNEKVCKNDNSVTFISNSFHAQPEAKSKASSGKDGETRKEDGDVSDSGDVPKSTNVGTILSRPQVSSRSGSSPNQNRTGTKRPGSPLKGPVPSQRRASTPPSQRRIQSSAARGTLGSPVSKTVPSSPSSSSQDNIPSPSPARKSRTEIGHPTSNQSENVNADTENDIVPPNVLSINPTAEFASFLGSLTSDNQTSQDQPSPPDTKPDTDVTFIKEEFVSEPSSCAQAGSSGQHSGRSGEDNSGLYPVMLHQNTSVFPSTSAGYHAYQGGASATATSQHPGFPGTSSSQSDPFNPVAGTSQDGADPSAWFGHKNSLPSSVSIARRRLLSPDQGIGGFTVHFESSSTGHKPASSVHRTSSSSSSLQEFRHYCRSCGKGFAYSHSMMRHRRKCEGSYSHTCQLCGKLFHRRDLYVDHMSTNHNVVDVPRHRLPLVEDPAALFGAGVAVEEAAAHVPHVSVAGDECRKGEEEVRAEQMAQLIAQQVSMDGCSASGNSHEEGKEG
ncbi:uncharacterized protein LOC143299655 isoform X2 [Babylonia areolata]|uniref:uncharacterized protein LOC143299655 isoform X2 n=1 Tax=Babylonia areolata TaxID=304850 RepID=UPI003FD0BF93